MYIRRLDHILLHQGAGVFSSISMANAGWSYATTDRAPACCSPAPVTDHTDAAESGTSATCTDFWPPSLHDGAPASSSSAFQADDSHMDWTTAYIGGTAAGVATTMNLNAFLQLHGNDAGRHFLLDQTPPQVQAQYDYDADGTAPVAAAPRMSCGDMPAAAMMRPFPQQHFSSFPGLSGIFGLAAEPPPILSQFKTEGGVQEAYSTVKRRSSVPDSPVAEKKPRIETPSPLPTFKVRKEKLGDRITALQQLVSPFGKTDTASVLHEAIEYIKFLHNQIASLSSPYLQRCGRHVQLPQQQDSKKAKNGEAKEDDLRGRGLCLVPLASTYTVANETVLEFWHPTFGATFR